MAEKTTGEMQATLGLDRVDDERDGADRPRRIPLAHLLRPGDGGRDSSCRCGSASSSRFCSVLPPRFVTRKWRSCIPARAVRITSPSNRF